MKEEESEQEGGVISLPLHQLLGRAQLSSSGLREVGCIGTDRLRRVRGILSRDSCGGEGAVEWAKVLEARWEVQP